MSPDVFISHSVKDKDQEVADRIYDYLMGKGIKCFMDKRDLIPGESFPDQITNAIEKSSAVILIFSANSDASSSVQNEIAIAAGCKIPVIPFRIEDTLPHGLRFFIAAPQWSDAFPQPLETHLPKLFEAVKHHLILDSLGKAEPRPQELKTEPPPQKFILELKDHYWHDIDYVNLKDWVKKRKHKLDAGQEVVGKMFRYKYNKSRGKYQIRLRYRCKRGTYTP